MTKKVLVTGGAGFIGSALCQELVRRRYNVVCLDNLYSGSKKNLEELLQKENFEFVKGDVRDKDLIDRIIKRTDIVFHLAAIVGVSLVVKEPLENISVNIEGVKNIAEAAFKYGKRRVIFSSSSEVYGKNSLVPLQEDKSESVFGPTSVNRWSYGLAKSIGEHILFAYGEKGLPFSIVRYFNCYGPRGINSKYANVIPNFISQALEGNTITVHGSGNQTRCFCYVEDTVRGTIQASKIRGNGVINIGSNKEISIKNLAKLVKRKTGSRSKIMYISEEKVFGKQFESSQRRVPDVRMAKKLLDFSPQVELEEGLERTIDWTRKHLQTAN